MFSVKHCKCRQSSPSNLSTNYHTRPPDSRLIAPNNILTLPKSQSPPYPLSLSRVFTICNAFFRIAFLTVMLTASCQLSLLYPCKLVIFHGLHPNWCRCCTSSGVAWSRRNRGEYLGDYLPIHGLKRCPLRGVRVNHVQSVSSNSKTMFQRSS